MKTKLLTLTLTLVCSFNIFAEVQGGRSGSGGDALVCYKTDTKKEIDYVQLWDYVEAEVEHGFEVNLQKSSNENYRDILKEAYKRLSDIEKQDKSLNISFSQFFDVAEESTSPFSLSGNIYKELIAMESGTSNFFRFVNRNQSNISFKIRNIDDMESRIEPDSNLCSIVQIAMQEIRPRGIGATIKINYKFWNHLSEEDKAGLILHEVLLFYVNLLNPKINEEHTRGIRDIVNYISTDEILNSDVNDYLMRLFHSNILLKDGNEIYDERHTRSPESIKYIMNIFSDNVNEDDSMLKESPRSSRFNRLYSKLTLARDTVHYLDPVNYRFPVKLLSSYVKGFYDLGYIKNVGLVEDTKIPTGSCYLVSLNDLGCTVLTYKKETFLVFHDRHVVESGVLVEDSVFDVNGQKVVLRGDSTITFHKNGYLKNAVLTDFVNYKDCDGEEYSTDSLNLDDNGCMVK